MNFSYPNRNSVCESLKNNAGANLDDQNSLADQRSEPISESGIIGVFAFVIVALMVIGIGVSILIIRSS